LAPGATIATGFSGPGRLMANLVTYINGSRPEFLTGL
jgi:hypothetical protein